MSIKVKILKENKKVNIKESMMDPGTLLMIAGALGVSVTILKSMFSGGSDSSGAQSALELARDGINAKLAKAGMSPEPKQKINQSDKPSVEQRLADMKAASSDAKAEAKPPALGMKDPATAAQEAEEAERQRLLELEIDKDVKLYVALKNKVRSGNAKMSNKKIQALIKKYSLETLEAMDNATDSKDDYYGSELDEIFKRFLK